jgi:hypothetical protein
MLRRAAVVSGTLACAWLMSSSAWASTGPWNDGYGRLGDVEISADRKRVALCDGLDDENKVAVQYRTTIGRTILLQAGPKSGCVTDSVFFGSIKRAKFCYGSDVAPVGTMRKCNPAHDI